MSCSVSSAPIRSSDGTVNSSQRNSTGENRSWGYDRIAGAIANLGHRVSDQAVGDILKRHSLPPAPERRKERETNVGLAILRTGVILPDATARWGVEGPSSAAANRLGRSFMVSVHSSDAGETWTHVGLKDVGQIPENAIHPENLGSTNG